MKLIINADDAGIDCSRNRGIFEAIDGGLVKSISVIVCQGGWDDIVERLQGKKDVGAGLHVNLTAGRPLVDGHRTLVKDDGCFFNKFDLFKRAMTGLIDADEVAREFEAQWNTFIKTGLKPSHVDGHNHVHLLPGAREGFMKVIPKKMWVRLPFEKNHPCLDPSGLVTAKIFDDTDSFIGVTNYLSLQAKKIWKRRFQYLDDFRGSKITAYPSLAAFKKAICEFNGDICELMCHPGCEPDKDSVGFSRLKERQMELKLLTSDELKDFIKRNKIKIISHKSLAQTTD